MGCLPWAQLCLFVCVLDLTANVDGCSLRIPLGRQYIAKQNRGVFAMDCSYLEGQHQCLQWIASISKVSIDVCGVSVWHWLVHCVGVSVNKPTNSRQTRGGEGGGATATVAVQN